MIYVCGPVSDRPDGNRLQFWRALGHVIDAHPQHACCTPHEIVDHDVDDLDAMRRCVVALCGHATMVYALPDWRESEGARVEVALALRLRLPVREIVDYEPFAWKQIETED